MEKLRPIVLVGGRSVRYGRDKLREVAGSWDGRERWLVDVPIAALRAVFGSCVLLVGECDVEVAARGDGVMRDEFPGVGPIGGIVSALRQEGAVLVLPGDLPRVSERVVREIRLVAERSPGAWAVLARTDRLEPCVGVYRAAALEPLMERVRGGNGPRRSLHDALPERHVALVDVAAAALANANTPEELARAVGGGRDQRP